MNILFDHQAFTIQNYGGVSRYFYEIINGLQTKNINTRLSLTYSNNVYLENSNFSYRKFLKKYEFKGKKYLLNQLNKLNTLNSIKFDSFDIFHPTYFDPYFIDKLKNRPIVVTVHDMIHEIYPNYFRSYENISKPKKVCTERADAVIAVSQNTKNDLIKYFGIDEKKITVIYHGNSLKNKNTDDLSTFDIPGKYLLFVGRRDKYKNFAGLVKEAQKLLLNRKDLYLVCAGGGDFSHSEVNLLKEYKIDDKVIFYKVDDMILSYLYRNAIAFVFPSLYEGFGIPVLEAFGNGCPTILADNSSLPEVGGNAALYFNPNNKGELEATIEKVLAEDPHRDQLVLSGYERLKDFSWENAVEKTKTVYKKVLSLN